MKKYTVFLRHYGDDACDNPWWAQVRGASARDACDAARRQWAQDHGAPSGDLENLVGTELVIQGWPAFSFGDGLDKTSTWREAL